MLRHSTNTASFLSVVIAVLMFSLSLAGVAAAQGNTSLGTGALQNNTTGSQNTAVGFQTLSGNGTGRGNTAIGFQANVSAGNLTNATAIGNGAIVNASNKVRLVNTAVTVISRVAESEFTTLPGNANQHSPFFRTRTAAPSRR